MILGVSSLITFTIDGIEYQAEEGMTWEEWCNSEYNVDGFWCGSGYVRPAGTIVAGVDLVSPFNVIINGKAYSIASLGGGAD